MVKEKKGHIVNIGSIAGLYPLSEVQSMEVLKASTIHLIESKSKNRTFEAQV